MALLEIENLSVEFPTAAGVARAVDRVSLSVGAGDLVGLVGESGAGKSLAMLAVMGLVPYPGRVSADRLRFNGRDLTQASGRRGLIGKHIAMIFQEPATSLNPCFTVGFQLMEGLRIHEGMGRKAARARAVELLEQVGIPAAEQRLKSYPHQLSGGMSQRVMIAMAIATNPELLIADEPTTALDVTVQAQILRLILSLQRDRGMGLILVTHDMGVIADTVERVLVMYAGEIVEDRSAGALFRSPQHPYSAALLAARPGQAGTLATIPGSPPSLIGRACGCRFGPRCTYATALSRSSAPQLRDWMDGRVRCHYPLGDAGRDARMAADGGVLPGPAP